MKQRKIDLLSVVTILLLCITSIAGILSMDFTKSYEFINQYGDSVLIYGAGLYQHDSYFKAPLSIGTDFSILFLLVPLFIHCCRMHQTHQSTSTKLKLISIYGLSLYYAASIAFGVTYNSLFLIYTALFSCSLFGLIYHMMTLPSVKSYPITTGLQTFLILAGIALLVAWFPDVLPTIGTGKSLPLIGVYTTEITYVLDMGIISPLCFLCVILLKQKKPIGTTVLAILLKASWFVGVMMIFQTALQILSHTDITAAALITKSISFLLLGFFAYYFEHKLYQQMQDTPKPNKRKHRILQR